MSWLNVSQARLVESQWQKLSSTSDGWCTSGWDYGLPSGFNMGLAPSVAGKGSCFVSTPFNQVRCRRCQRNRYLMANPLCASSLQPDFCTKWPAAKMLKTDATVQQSVSNLEDWPAGRCGVR